MLGLKHGDEVVCRINGFLIEDARVNIPNYGELYICHNEPSADGSGDRLFGYKYSWSFDSHVTELRKKGEKYIEKIGLFARMPIGCDPEFFYLKDGKVFPSEKVLPKDGILNGSGKIIIDGVQAELNPTADTCRERLAYGIAQLIREVKKGLPNGVSISFDPLVPIQVSELSKLSDKAKFFGCTPSFNAYDVDNKMEISDSSKYPFRPAGGHIHLGHGGNKMFKQALKNVKTLIPIMDIIVGNTCVLVDRHEGNKERRKCYGRAGEYRTPKHGIEYRTLSNFWLKSYPLMSMVFGLSRLALNIVLSSTKENNLSQELLEMVDIEDIRKAINTNDFDLALKNFSKVRGFLEKRSDTRHSLYTENIPLFLHFVGKIKEQGLEYWFKGRPEDFWSNYASGNINRGYGWESFLATVVINDMKKK